MSFIRLPNLVIAKSEPGNEIENFPNSLNESSDKVIVTEIIEVNFDDKIENSESKEQKKIFERKDVVLLQNIIDDKKLFDELYLTISTEAINYFKMSKCRGRSITRLTSDIANIYFSRRAYKTASQYLKKVSIEDGWYKITTDVCLKLAECEYHLHNPEIYITACLGLVGPECNEKIRKYFQQQLQLTASNNLRAVVLRDFYPLLDCKLKYVSNTLYHIGDELVINCVIDSFLISEISFDKISLWFSFIFAIFLTNTFNQFTILIEV